MNGKEKKPGAIYYVFAAILLAGGVTLFVAWLYSGLSDMTGAMIRIKAPGKTDITLAEPGGYLIFHEYRTVMNGERYSSEGALAGMRFSLADKATGRDIKLAAPKGNYTYSMGERSGVAVSGFTIERSGVYRFSSWRENGSAKPEAVLAIGKGFFRKLIVTAIGGLGILFASVGGAAVMFAFVYHKRRADTSEDEDTDEEEGQGGEGPRPIHPGW